MVPSFVNVLIIRDNKGRYQNTSPTTIFPHSQRYLVYSAFG